MPRPDLRIASTMEKLDCSVFSAATAAYACQLNSHADVYLAYRIVALLHLGRAVVETSGWCNAQTEQASPGYEHEGIISLMLEERCVTFVGKSPASDGARASSAVLAYFKWAFDPSVTPLPRTSKDTYSRGFLFPQPTPARMIGCQIIPTLSNGIRPNALSLWFRKTQHDIRNAGYASNHSVPEEKAYPMVRNITRSFMALFPCHRWLEKNTVVVLFDTSE
jgi:hypothetical protein